LIINKHHHTWIISVPTKYHIQARDKNITSCLVVRMATKKCKGKKITRECNKMVSDYVRVRALSILYKVVSINNGARLHEGNKHWRTRHVIRCLHLHEPKLFLSVITHPRYSFTLLSPSLSLSLSLSWTHTHSLSLSLSFSSYLIHVLPLNGKRAQSQSRIFFLIHVRLSLCWSDWWLMDGWIVVASVPVATTTASTSTWTPSLTVYYISCENMKAN
jgi:hypothetical protein